METKGESKTKRYLITGVAVVLPLWLTTYVVWLLIKLTGNLIYPWLSPWSQKVFHGPIPEGAWLLVCASLVFVLLWVIGFLTLEIFGHGHWQTIDALLARIPIVRSIHLTIRRLVDLLISPKKKFERVAFVEFPLPGQYALGFVTRETPVIVDGKRYVNVLVPTAPNPTSGFLLFTPENEVRFADLDVDEAMEIIFSVGLIGPDVIPIKKNRGL